MDSDRFPRHLVHRRRRALALFEEWERRHPSHIGDAAAIAGVGFLYDLLPPASRYRPVDVTGVRELHRRLRYLRVR